MDRSFVRALAHRLAWEIEVLIPGSFAFVMATGIISVAAASQGMPRIAYALLIVDVIGFGVLSILFALRLIFWFPRILADLREPLRGPGFFTLVAGTCVVGSDLLVVADRPEVAEILWYVGIGLWIVVMYGFFTAIISRRAKPSLEKGISGAWLIASVATQSVALLGTLLAPGFETGREVALFFALSMYLLGAMLYLNIIALIFYRFTFLPLTTERLSPSYWINMGAVAITTLAGSTLLLHAHHSELLTVLKPFLLGFTLFFWAAGTWWIPLLLILGIWRHVIHRFPLTYDPNFWSGVFPLGMYTVATHQLGRAAELGFLEVIPSYFILVAFLAWAVASIGMVRTIGRSLFVSGS